MGAVLKFPGHGYSAGITSSAKQAAPLILEIPADLAGRIGAAAVWIPKSGRQLALDTLQQAFPPTENVA